MENKLVEVAKKEIENFDKKKISRKDAIKRTGYIAASAATMMILLSKSSQANTSRCAPPPDKKTGHQGGDSPWH